MTNRLSDKPLTWKQSDSENTELNFLVLHNDDIHSFDYVINSLVEICEHSFVQAEQCTIIAHFKGKCEVKKGDRKNIETLQTALAKKGLITTIE